MSSHITVSSVSPASSGASPTGTNPLNGGSSGPLGAFGALLSALQAAGTATTPAGSTAAKPTGFTQPASNDSPSNLADALQQALQAVTGGGTASAPLAATAAADATATAPESDAGTPPQLLRDLVDSLTALDKAEQSGKPIDQDLLKRVKKAIDALAGFLGTQQPVIPPLAAVTPAAAGSDAAVGGVAAASADTGTAAASGTTAPGGGASAKDDGTATAKATLGALSDKLAAMSSDLAGTASDISSKLEQLAKSLDPAKLSGDTLAQLGLTSSSSSTDPKLASAISSLVNDKPQPAATLQPTLAAPALKLPDGTAIAGSSSDKPKSVNAPASTGSQTASTLSSHNAPVAANKPGDGSGNGNGSSKDQSKNDANGASSAATIAAAAAKDAAGNATPPAAPSDGSGAPAVLAAAAASPVQTAAAAYAPATAAQVNLPQMAVEIVRHMQQGSNHFQIRLDPADMGRIDVKLAVDNSGAVNARVTVERPETLALLQRDAGQLGQALTQAGLDGSKTNLQFSLSQNPFAGQDGRWGNGSGNNGGSAPSRAPVDDDAISAVTGPAAAAIVYRGTATASGLNIVV